MSNNLTTDNVTVESLDYGGEHSDLRVEFEMFGSSDIRNAMGQVKYGKEWQRGHDYGEGEVSMFLLSRLSYPSDGSGYIIRKDGDMWMCARDNFVNLQESNSEFGETPTIAMANFLQREDEMQREWQERMEEV